MNGCISNQFEKISVQDINNSINKGINFLYENQLDYGEFKTFACSDLLMQNCSFDSSPFITTFVLYSIKNIKNEKVEVMTNKAIDFLLSEQESGGVWRYWSSRSTKHSYISPDFDDISVISAILVLYNQSFDENIKLFDEYRNENGIIYTWLKDKSNNEIDCEVNSNTLFYFGLRNINDIKICDFINRHIVEEKYNCCIYCEDGEADKNYLLLFYIVSRAYIHGNSCLGQIKKNIIYKTLILQKEDGSFGNDLDTAIALNTLLNFNYHGNEVNLGVNSLVQKQLISGSWKKQVFYLDGMPNYYGSEELTTALAIEAMNKYLKSLTIDDSK